MPNIELTFSQELNELVQKGDTLYYANTTDYPMQDGTTEKFSNTVVEVGEITAINYTNKTITANIENTTALPTTSSFFLFGKDNRINMASLLGYYCEVELTNNSTEKVELYSVGTEIVESSK